MNNSIQTITSNGYDTVLYSEVQFVIFANRQCHPGHNLGPSPSRPSPFYMKRVDLAANYPPRQPDDDSEKARLKYSLLV